ncbi:CLUMA_CG001822, isoform A [Clunio marinus]|uniref:CLUMA_CG001822, isoform A n=1 Tax=Clunio marinus TaxID=568069 RepID=A0A1J1HKV9_9DIPT|nr:CLUMA_CG001822, isoform A [Clunio marinus]
MEFSCGFCTKTEEEVPLIEISSNSLLISGKSFEFLHIFHELFEAAHEDLITNFICENCKDSAVQFFIFKRNVKSRQNPYRKTIINQVEQFLCQSENIEDIQVVRKFSSLTLKIEQNDSISVNKEPEDYHIETHNEVSYGLNEELEHQQAENVLVVIHCAKCNEDLPNSVNLELHKFFKHSLFGIQLENEVESSRKLLDGVGLIGKFDTRCANCFLYMEEFNSYSCHLLKEHSLELFQQLNDALYMNSEDLNSNLLHKYIESIIEILQTGGDVKISEDIKKYFFDIYSGETLDEVLIVTEDNQVINEVLSSEDEIVQEEGEEVVIEALEQTETIKSKQEKSNIVLTGDDRLWLRKEIRLRKSLMKNEKGTSRAIYRCTFCNEYCSNSAPGFRYHLINKHLKENNLRELQTISDEATPPKIIPRTWKNICNDCGVKFKDQKALKCHQTCHQLFDFMAQDYSFPFCNDCNSFFIDTSSLNVHLMKHDTNDELTQPIEVTIGSAMFQGKEINYLQAMQNDLIADGFPSWNCGHCTRKFEKEDSCRFHLLMFHARSFTCPVDNREFSGFKAVTLFTHHLKNKHSELFPEITFPCSFCKTEFPTIYDKLAHMKSCSLKKFSCDHCGKKFFKKGELIAHLKFVNGELFFPCEVCSKKCETISDLKIHFRSHTREKPFACTVCFKPFRTLAARSAHMDKHGENFMFVCHCGKSFKQRQLYCRHLKAVHKSEKLDDFKNLID